MENTTKKITKREYLNVLRDIVESNDFTFENPDMTTEGLINFIDNEIELLNHKAQSAQKRAADKREEGDELRTRIVDILDTENYMTINEIMAVLNDEALSPQMVISRLSQGCKMNLVEKDLVPFEIAGKTKKLSAYRKLA